MLDIIKLHVYIHSCVFLDVIKLYGQFDRLLIIIYSLEQWALYHCNNNWFISI
jgi:hypothetical protein